MTPPFVNSGCVSHGVHVKGGVGSEFVELTLFLVGDFSEGDTVEFSVAYEKKMEFKIFSLKGIFHPWDEQYEFSIGKKAFSVFMLRYFSH